MARENGPFTSNPWFPKGIPWFPNISQLQLWIIMNYVRILMLITSEYPKTIPATQGYLRNLFLMYQPFNSPFMILDDWLCFGWIIAIHKSNNSCYHTATWGWFPSHSSFQFFFWDVRSWSNSSRWLYYIYIYVTVCIYYKYNMRDRFDIPLFQWFPISPD